MTSLAIRVSYTVALAALSFACEPAEMEAVEADPSGIFEAGEMVGEPGEPGEPPRGVYVVTDVEAPELEDVEPVLYSAQRIFYMNRHGGTYHRSHKNDSTENETTIGNAISTIPPWNVPDEGWAQVMDCVRDQFSRFNVYVTDVDPGDVPHIESVVAGRPEDLGLPGNVGGVSPFASNCSVIERSVVYSFAELFDDNYQFLCQVVAQEIAHSIGLDHELLCEDPMTYLGGCGAKSFQDIAAPCGESEERPCACDAPSQNSVQMLRSRLGSAGDTGDSPDVSIVSPRSGDAVSPGFELKVDAFDDDGIDEVLVRVDGVEFVSLASAPYRIDIDMPLELGRHSVSVEVIDNSGASTYASVDVFVATGGDLLTDPTKPLDDLLAGCSAAGGSGGHAGLLVLVLGGLWLGRHRRRRGARRRV